VQNVCLLLDVYLIHHITRRDLSTEINSYLRLNYLTFRVYCAVSEESEGKKNPVTLALTSTKEYGKGSFTEKKSVPYLQHY
jgi:hypothetical protein